MKRVFFAVAVAAIALVSCNQANTQSLAGVVAQEGVDSVSASSQLAYVSVEMVVSMSDIFNKEGVALQTKTQKAQEGWSKKEQGFQYEASQLQEKYQKGLITTANAQKEQESLESRMRTFQTTAQREAQELDEENRVFSNRTQDLVRRAVDQINSDGKYKMIVNANSLIDADTTLDISTNVLEVMNQLYTAEKK
ncbi:MAG: OmpH family outer membrane protein [Rikenellaceae bacterium]